MTMNINISNLNSVYRLGQQKMAVNTFMRPQLTVKGSIDMFIRSGSTVNDAGVYSPFSKEKDSYISDLLLLVVNNDSSKVRKHGETYEVAGVQFTADQIPRIDTSKLSEIKACNNIIDFGQNHYFKYVSSDGTEHALFTNDKGVGVHYSEHGFFTVKMGNREATQYYTKSENTSAIQSKERYDSKYEHITSTGYQLMNYEPGSVFNLNGKEYVLSQNHTLDIPYGEDIYNLQYPSNYRFGEKID